ncbi:MAG: protein-disulfide reductase DsbD family protein [Candidatus Brocadiales bacterium]
MRFIIASIFIISVLLPFGVDELLVFDKPLYDGPVAIAAGDDEGIPSNEKSKFTRFTEKILNLNFTEILDRYGIAIAVVLAFVWGIVAGVASPCVLPLVPITVAYFATQGETKGKGYTILLACVYVLGIATLFTPLGVIFARAGKSVGALLGNPFFIGPFVAFLVVMALSMFGLFEIKLPSFITSRLQGGERRQGIVGTFVLGIILGLIAMPCVGPFLASVLGFVGTQGSVLVGGAALFSFSLGLGMPYLALAISAKALAGMPKAGDWMIRVKQFAGLVILLVAVYFLSKVIPMDAAKIMGGIIIVFIGVFLDILSWKQVTGWNIVGRAIGVLLALGGLMLLTWGALGLTGLYQKAPSLGPAEEIKWVTSFDEGMKLAKDAGKPVFIDFYAEWCTDCKLMEVKTWANEDVIKESERFVAIQLDCSENDSPYNKLRIERFKSFAMPVAVFFDSAGNYLEEYSLEGYTGSKKFLEIARAIK